MPAPAPQTAAAKRPHLLFIAPLPPPYAGPELAAESLLHSSFAQRFRVHVVPARLQPSNNLKGRVTLGSVFRLGATLCRMAYTRFRYRCGAAYLYISQNRSGILRDLALFIVLRLLRCRVVWHFHGGNLDVFYRACPPLRRRWLRWMLNHSQAMIVLGPSVAARLRAVGLTVPMHVVPNWAPNINGLRDSFPPPPLRADTDAVTVLALGSVSVAKGSADLLRAAEKVLHTEPRVRFVIAGECIENERNILRDEAGDPLSFESIRALLAHIQERYPDNVIYAGVAGPQKKWVLLKSADLLVLPSYSEGFPIAILEAMLVGLPVVTTPVGAIPDFLRPNENACFVPPGQVDALADAILYLVRDPHERQRIGANNYDYVRASLTLENSVHLLSTVLQDAFTAQPAK